ncbi:MAG: hypothetical protein WD512_12295 [Candidatus Paceibacterota bacterium]
MNCNCDNEFCDSPVCSTCNMAVCLDNVVCCFRCDKNECMHHARHVDAYYTGSRGEQIAIVCIDCVRELVDNDDNNYFFHAKRYCIDYLRQAILLDYPKNPTLAIDEVCGLAY